jgi:hypothetical protein
MTNLKVGDKVQVGSNTNDVATVIGFSTRFKDNQGNALVRLDDNCEISPQMLTKIQ